MALNNFNNIQDPARKKISGYTNINRIVDANQQNQLGTTIQSGIEDKAAKTRQDIQNQTNAFNQQAVENRLGTEQNIQKRQNILDRFAGSSGFQSPSEEEVKDFSKFRAGEYKGPMELNAGERAVAASKAEEAEKMGSLAKTQGGRQALLQRFVGSPDYTQGQQKLDTLLLGQGNPLNQARRQTIGLTNLVNQAQQRAVNLGQQYKQEASEFGRQTGEKLSNLFNPLEETLKTQAEQKLKSGEENRANILGKLKAESGLTNDELKGLGLNDQQIAQYRIAEAASGANYVSGANITGRRFITNSGQARGPGALEAIRNQENSLYKEMQDLKKGIYPPNYNPVTNTFSYDMGYDAARNWKGMGQKQAPSFYRDVIGGKYTDEQLQKMAHDATFGSVTGASAISSEANPLMGYAPSNLYSLQEVTGTLQGPELAALLANAQVGDRISNELATQLGFANQGLGVTERAPIIGSLNYEQRPDFEFERYLSDFDRANITKETAATQDQLLKANALRRLMGTNPEYDINKAGTASTDIKLDQKAIEDAINELFKGGVTIDPETGKFIVENNIAQQGILSTVNTLDKTNAMAMNNKILMETLGLGDLRNDLTNDLSEIGGSVYNTISDIPLVGNALQLGEDTIQNFGSSVEKLLPKSAGTVICTELYRQGLMPTEIYEKDQEFGRNLIKNDPEVYEGYVVWAAPLAKLMAKSSIITTVIKPFALSWANEMAGNANFIGKTILHIGIPFCRLIGKTLNIFNYVRSN